MATVNLGRIKPVFRGAYAGGTAYVVDDIVTSGDETFICIQASTGNATSNASYWTKLAAKGTDGTDVGTTITTQGDILYRDGSGLQRLAKGTAGQVLKINSGATAPEWGTDAGGGVKQVKHAHITGTQSFSHTSSSNQTVSNSEVSLTPSATGNKIFILANCHLGAANDISMTVHRKIGSGSWGAILLNTQRGSETLAHSSLTNRTGYEVSPNIAMLLDAPNTTSQVYYMMTVKNAPEGGGTGYINRPTTSSTSANQETVVSSLTIMEIDSGVL